MYELAPSIELLFTEAGADCADRVRAAADAGFRYVDMWMHSDKDLDRLAAALSETGVQIWTMLAEPRAPLGDPAAREAFLSAVDKSAAVATDLGCERIVTGSGVGDLSRKRRVQHDCIVEVLKPAGEIAAAHGVTLLLENVNHRVDHPGSLLDTAAECIEILREVDSPNVRLLYDLYHSVVEGEVPAVVLEGAGPLVSHVQIADHPGRGEPGTGGLDWPALLADLRRIGYEGPLGVECFPTTSTSSALKLISEVAATA